MEHIPTTYKEPADTKRKLPKISRVIRNGFAWTEPLFKPPVYDDEDETHAARFLSNSLKVLFIFILIVAPMSILLGISWLYLGILAGAFLAGVAALNLLHRNMVKLAGIILVSLLWVDLIIPMFFLGGLQNPIVVLPVAVILLGGVLAGARYGVGLGIATIFIYTLLLILENANLLLPPAPETLPLHRWLSLSATILATTFLIRLTIDSLRTALERARNNEKELATSNLALRSIQNTLQQRIEERTYALERRAIQFEASAEIARAITSVHNLDILLPNITQLISDRFGFYHIGVFLTEETGDTVVLHAANSSEGQVMLQRGHRLQIGQVGIVSSAAQSRRPHISTDVDKDQAFYRNPDLPETRSEMALPLIAGEKLVGILDVQSTEAEAFSQEDITIMQTLADQIAIAIENALLFAENQQVLESVQSAYGSLTRDAWKRLLRAKPELGYRTSSTGLATKSGGTWSPDMAQARITGRVVKTDDTLVLPIVIREQVTGVIKLRKPEEAGEWTDDEIELIETLNDRLSVALESARLYEETQRRAERERMTGEITARVRASNDPQVILQTAVSELRRALQVQRVQVVVHRPTDELDNIVTDENIKITDQNYSEEPNKVQELENKKEM